MALLNQYFKSGDFEHVFDACYNYFREMNWDLKDRADIYIAAQSAFDPSQDEYTRRSNFGIVYNNLSSYWGYFAILTVVSGLLLKHMTSYRVPVSCAVESILNLLNWQPMKSNDRIWNCIEKMRALKPMGEYPHMAVSKFLHFYNPTLFPIYDRKVIWEKVCSRAFLEEWKQVCHQTGIKFYETTGQFNYSYYKWAASLITDANSELMLTFATWFRKHANLCANIDQIPLETYYATAFECIAIGAMAIENREA